MAAIPKPPANKKTTQQVIYIIIIFLIALGLYNIFSATQTTEIQEVTISEIVVASNEDKVEQIEVDGDKVTADLNDGTILQAYKEEGASLS